MDYTDLKTRLNYARSLYKAAGIDGEHGAQMMADALAAIEELEERNQWEPIETAPKDGTRFVVLISEAYRCARYRPDICYWDATMGVFIFDSWAKSSKPTHWMPLPQPPEQDQ